MWDDGFNKLGLKLGKGNIGKMFFKKWTRVVLKEKKKKEFMK